MHQQTRAEHFAGEACCSRLVSGYNQIYDTCMQKFCNNCQQIHVEYTSIYARYISLTVPTNIKFSACCICICNQALQHMCRQNKCAWLSTTLLQAFYQYNCTVHPGHRAACSTCWSAGHHALLHHCCLQHSWAGSCQQAFKSWQLVH